MNRVMQYIYNNYCKQTEIEVNSSVDKKALNMPSVELKTKLLKEAFSFSLISELDEGTIQSCFETFIHNIDTIPPSVKGSVKGEAFSKLVHNELKKIERYNLQIYREKFPDNYPKCYERTIPDFYITDGDKIVVLMCQLDFWSGGQQRIRGRSYVTKKPYKNFRFLSVICYKPSEVSLNPDGELFDMFNTGIYNKNLCYIKNMNGIILNHYGLN